MNRISWNFDKNEKLPVGTIDSVLTALPATDMYVVKVHGFLKEAQVPEDEETEPNKKELEYWIDDIELAYEKDLTKPLLSFQVDTLTVPEGKASDEVSRALAISEWQNKMRNSKLVSAIWSHFDTADCAVILYNEAA